jgi:hypothetical protein
MLPNQTKPHVSQDYGQSKKIMPDLPVLLSAPEVLPIKLLDQVSVDNL